jgi:hypothetical protein
LESLEEMFLILEFKTSSTGNLKAGMNTWYRKYCIALGIGNWQTVASFRRRLRIDLYDQRSKVS